MGTKRLAAASVRSFLLGMALVTLPAGAPAQVAAGAAARPESPSENVFGLGLFGGSASGIGLSFRHHLPNPLSYTVTGGIIKVNGMDYSIGGEIQFDFSRAGSHRVFAVAGLGYYYSGSTEKNDLEAPFRCGIGVGGEIATGSGLHISIDLLFTYFSDKTVLPLPQAGIYYYFY